MYQRIDQFLPCYAPFDAIGTHATHMQRLLRDKGIASDIFYETPFPATEKLSASYKNYKPQKNAAVIYHHSIGSRLPWALYRDDVPTIVDYHNITPAPYFAGVQDFPTAEVCRSGLRQIDLLALQAQGAWADSQYNANELLEQGFAKVDVLSILRDYGALQKLEDVPELAKVISAKPTILFVGRLVPNKAQHDLLLLLKTLRQGLGPARLFLVGGICYPYWLRLLKIAEALGLKISRDWREDADVVIPGQLSDQELATIYRHAGAFVSMSEHEGFCVPLIEAMFFSLPIVAHKAAVIPETLHDGGILADKSNWQDFANTVQKVLTDAEYAKKCRVAGAHRKNAFAWQNITSRFYELVKPHLF